MKPEEVLIDLGFNSLEAEVYTHLLRHPPMTAYAVAKALRRQTANVYKGIEVLSKRGAVLVEDGARRICRAVPVAEFLRHHERDFLARTRVAQEKLAQLYKPSFDERVYRVESVSEIMERAEAMISEATTVVMLDAFPKSLDAMLPAVKKCIRRGVSVYVQSYTPVEIPGAESVVAYPGSDVLQHWRSEQLNLVVDGREHLVALLSESHDEVFQATWSRSLYLSCLLHSGLMSEHTIHRLMHAGGDRRAIERILGAHRMFLNSEVPGQHELASRMKGHPAPSRRTSRKKEPR